MNVNDGPSFSYAAISAALTGDNTIIAGVSGKATNGSMTLPFDEAPWFKTSPGNGFVINSSGIAVQQSGVVVYSLSPANVQP